MLIGCPTRLEDLRDELFVEERYEHPHTLERARWLVALGLAGSAAAHPAEARLCLVEAPAASAASSARYDAAVDGYIERLRGAAPSGVGRPATLVEALLKTGLTLGGGLAAADAWWRHTGLGEPWRGVLVVVGSKSSSNSNRARSST